MSSAGTDFLFGRRKFVSLLYRAQNEAYTMS